MPKENASMDDRANASLQVSLAIRHRLAALGKLAREITLVAMNAKVSSAQLGGTGAAFSVMTQEIQLIAASLKQTVDDVRALTREWTRLSAQIATNQNRFDQFQKASRQHPTRFATQLQSIDRELLRLQRQTPQMVTRLIDIVEDMERSLRVVNYVTVGILMESERLGAQRQDSQQQPFEVLAEEMRDASEQIRNLATYSVQQMQRLQGHAA